MRHNLTTLSIYKYIQITKSQAKRNWCFEYAAKYRHYGSRLMTLYHVYVWQLFVTVYDMVYWMLQWLDQRTWCYEYVTKYRHYGSLLVTLYIQQLLVTICVMFINKAYARNCILNMHKLTKYPLVDSASLNVRRFFFLNHGPCLRASILPSNPLFWWFVLPGSDVSIHPAYIVYVTPPYHRLMPAYSLEPL